MHSFVLTEHGILRARERAGWDVQATQRMVPKVFFNGLDQACAPKPLRRYLANVMQSKACCLVKTYGEHLFVFSPTGIVQEFKFITIYQMPHALRKYSHHG
jgi:hypothetical protein